MATTNEAISSLEEAVRMLGHDLPSSLKDLLLDARALSGKPLTAPDKEIRYYIYRAMYSFLVHENGIGDGASLIYPPEIVATIRQLYPGDVKNYPPQSRKRKNFYEVQLQELIEVYHEEDLRKCSRKGRESLPSASMPGPSKKPKKAVRSPENS